VKDCIGSKRDVINVGVDDGKWYDLNLQGVKDSEMSSATGFVKDASCNCVDSSMGICSHVATVLISLLDYTQQFGTEQASCTSRIVNGRRAKKKERPQKVENQRSDEWFHQRAMRITASNAKSVSTLKTESSVFNKLKKIVYKTDPIKTRAMTYGIEHENGALKDYTLMKQKQSSLLEVAQCDLWVNPKYPELACSPDGLVRDVSDSGEDDFGLVEIKCSFMLDKCSVKDFEKSLSKSQMAFFLP
ncbi:Hypothetical predicted protein, partial [Mytilus galloprovincialis]